jgi:fatty acid desaturase
MSLRIQHIVARDALNFLTRPSNFIAWGHLSIRIAGEALLFTAALYFLERSMVLCVLFFYACAIWHSFWGYAGLGHELFHARVFSARWLNKAGFHIASYLTWNNPEFFCNSHNHHHQFAFAQDDVEGFSRQNWGWFSIVCYLSVDLPLVVRRLYYVVINAAGLLPRANGYMRVDPSIRKQAQKMLVFHVLIQCAIWLSLSQWQANLMWFLMPFSGQFLNRLLAQSQHIGLAGFKESGPLQYARTVRLPAILEFLYAGMNFHAEHHLAPAIPYYKLQLLHAQLTEKKLLTSSNAYSFFIHDIWHEIRNAQAGT